MSGATDKAYAEIRRRLLRGEFDPGSRLSESDLSDMCGVSRTPVREALRKLALEYFVRLEPNRGAFVIDWSREDISDIFEMRSMMEGLAARKAAERASKEQIEQLFAIVESIDEVARRADEAMLSDFLELNRRFHDVIFMASGSQKLMEIISRFVEQAVVVRTAIEYTPDDILRSNQHHRELVLGIQGGNGLLCETIMRAHILAASSQYHDKYMPAKAPVSKVLN